MVIVFQETGATGSGHRMQRRTQRYAAAEIVRAITLVGYDRFLCDTGIAGTALASPAGKTLLADLPNLTNDIYAIIVEYRKLDD